MQRVPEACLQAAAASAQPGSCFVLVDVTAGNNVTNTNATCTVEARAVSTLTLETAVTEAVRILAPLDCAADSDRTVTLTAVVGVRIPLTFHPCPYTHAPAATLENRIS